MRYKECGDTCPSVRLCECQKCWYNFLSVNDLFYLQRESDETLRVKNQYLSKLGIASLVPLSLSRLAKKWNKYVIVKRERLLLVRIEWKLIWKIWIYIQSLISWFDFYRACKLCVIRRSLYHERRIRPQTSNSAT